MGESAERESILIGVATLVNQFENEITAADVVHEVAEFGAAEGIVAEILDDGATVGIGMRFGELVFGQIGETLEEERANVVGPHQVHDSFVSENRISKAGAAREQDDEQERERTDGKGQGGARMELQNADARS